MAPLTQDGDTRQAEEQPPNGTWRGVPLRACQAGSFLLASFSHFRAARRFKPVPASAPPHLPPIPTACFPLSLVILGFLTLQTKVGPEQDTGAAGAIWLSLFNSSRPQASLDSTDTLDPARPELKGGEGCRGSLLMKRGLSH